MSEQFFAVMFADIAGSSALYKQVGDTAAKAAVFSAIDKMSDLIKKHEGTLVKFIGDEVLCYFSSADLAVLAAKNIQLAFQEPFTNIEGQPKLAVRIGIHWGPAILDQADIFGDAVNTAARMVAAAKENQIVTTVETVTALNPFLKGRCRAFDVVRIKAFPNPIALYLVTWEEEMASDATYVSTGFVSGQTAQHVDTVMAVRFRDESFVINSKDDIFVMGRDSNKVSLCINTRFASRRHAWIEFRRGKFVLFDHSTNGTYVQFQNDRELFLKREEIPLRGSGMISLGQHVKDNENHLLYFDCTE